jgi:hypothetical protein
VSDRIEQIRARLNMAHDGPWTAADDPVGPWTFIYAPGRVEIAHASTWAGRQNAPLITNARADIEWLLEQVEELTKRVRMYEVVKS